MFGLTRELVDSAFVPHVLVRASDSAQTLVHQLTRSERAMSVLLGPHVTSKLRVSNLEMAGQVMRPSTVAVADEAPMQSLADGPRAARVAEFRGALGNEAHAAPWFVSYAKMYGAGFGAAAHDYLTHYHVCVVVAELSDDVAQLSSVFEPQAPPKVMMETKMDTQLDVFYILLKVKSDERKAEKAALEHESRCVAAFGRKRCLVLSVDAPAPNELAQHATRGGGSSAAKSKSGRRRRKHQSGEQPANESSGLRELPLADVLSAEDVAALRKFFSSNVRDAVTLRQRAASVALNEHVTHKRSKMSTLRGWLSGNKNKSKKSDGAGGSSVQRSLEEQTRLLADYFFALGEYESAVHHYKSASSDFKNDKAYLQYASAQEMTAAAMIKDSERRRRDATAIAHLNNAYTYYVRAGAVDYAQRVALLLQALLRAADQHLQAADVCVRAAELAGTDELYEAVMQEQTAHCYLYRRVAPMFRRCTFRLVVAGACYDGTGERAHALRCYAAAFAAYEANGWPLINEQLHTLLVRHYAMQGQLERALHFALTMLTQSANATAPNMQASHLREYLYLHQAMHASSAASRARAIARYAHTVDAADDDDDDDGDADGDDEEDDEEDYEEYEYDENDADVPAKVRDDVKAIAAHALAPLPLPVVSGNVDFVFQDASVVSTQTNSESPMTNSERKKPLTRKVSPNTGFASGGSGGGVDVLGVLDVDELGKQVWSQLERRLVNGAISSGSGGGGSGKKAQHRNDYQQQNDTRLLADGPLKELWLRDANAQLGVLRPVSVVNEPVVVRLRMFNPVSLPLQLTGVRLLATLEHADGDGKLDSSEAAFRALPIDVLLAPNETAVLQLSIAPLAIGLLHVRGVAFSLAGQVEGSCLFGARDDAASGAAAAAATQEGNANASARNQRVQAARDKCAHQVLVAPPMPLMEATLVDVPSHMVEGECVQLRLRLRNAGQCAMRNVLASSNDPRCVWLGASPSAAFCTPVAIDGGELAPGKQHDMSVRVRVVRDQNSNKVLCKLALLFYYESADAATSELAYRFQRLQVRINVAPSIQVACETSVCADDPRCNWLSVVARSQSRDAVFRLCCAALHSRSWKLADDNAERDINALIVRPGQSTRLLFRVGPRDAQTDAEAGESTCVPLYTGATHEAGAGDAAFLLTDVKRAALRAMNTGASDGLVTARDLAAAQRRPNFADLLLHWEIANGAANQRRVGVSSVIDVPFDRLLSSGAQVGSLAQLAAPKLPAIDAVRFRIECPRRVTFVAERGDCTADLCVQVYNSHPSESIECTLVLLKPHEALLSEGKRPALARKRGTRANVHAGGGSVAERRRNARRLAMKTAGPGTGGGGGVRAKGTCMFVGRNRRGPFVVPPRATQSVPVRVSFAETGIHNVGRMRLVVEGNELTCGEQVFCEVL